MDRSKPGNPPPSTSAPVNPLPGGVTDDAILNLVRERRQHAMNRYLSYFRRVSRWYDLFRGLYSGRFAAYRNNVHIPMLFSVVQSDVARKVQTSFGGWPIVEFSGYSHEDAWKARKNEVLVSAQMKDCDSFRKAVDFFLSADLYGTAIARVGWRTDQREESYRDVGIDNMGRRGMMTQKRTVTTFDGPDWEPVDILDFLIQPGKRRIDQAAWVIHRHYIDLDELEEQAKLGFYDMDAVKRLRGMGSMPSTVESDYLQRVNIYRSYSEYDARRTERYAKPVEIWEMWGRVPSEFSRDGQVHRVISVANGSVVLKNRPNPFWHGKLPFLAYSPTPDPHYFHAPGKMEVAEKMQYAANRFANQKLDALDLVIDPMWLVNSSMGMDTQNLFTRAGRTIKVDGPIGEDMIRTLSPDLRGLQAAFQEIGFLWSNIQQATGIIEDTIQGVPVSKRQTAQEFRGRQESVLTRLMLEARLAEEGFVEPLADMFVALNKQYLTFPKEVRILGNDAIVNPITGLPLPKDPINFSNLEDVVHDYRARAVGATQMMGKAMQQQQLVGLMQIVGGIPIGAQMVNWEAFIRQIFDAFDLRNVDELLRPNEMQMALQAQMNAGGQGGAPAPQDAFASALQGGSEMDMAQAPGNLEAAILGA